MDIAEMTRDLEIALLTSEGVITSEIEELMNKIEKDKNIDKTLSWLLKKYESAEALVKTRKEKLDLVKNKVETATNSVEYWKKQIDFVLSQNKLENITVDEYDLSYRLSKAVEIYNDELIPKDFINTKIQETFDKIRIKKALEDGSDVPGAVLKTNKNLQIK